MITAAHVLALRAAPQQRLNERGRVSDLAQQGLMWLAFAALLFVLGPRYGYGTLLAGVAALWLQFLWHEQFASLCRQNHPNAARLVPGHMRVLRETAVGLWLLISALTGLLMGLSFTWTLAAAVAMLVGALFISRVWVATWLVVALSLWPSLFGRNFFDALRRARAAWEEAAQLPITVALLLVGAWLLCLLLRDGNAAHRRAHASRTRSRLASESSASGRSMLRHTGRIGETLILLTEAPLRAWARRLLARAEPTPRSALARADLVLGAHWVQQLGGLLVFVAIGVLTVAVCWFGFGLDVWKHRGYSSLGVGIGFTCAALGPLLGLISSVHASRREQALLMLLPGMPRGAALNRRLARRHAIRLLLSWAAAMALLMLLNWGTPTFALALAFGTGCLPAATLLVVGRDWSRLPPSTAGRQGLHILSTVLGGLLAALLVRQFPALETTLPAALLVLSAALALLGWQRAARLPQALPAGRLDSAAPTPTRETTR